MITLVLTGTAVGGIATWGAMYVSRTLGLMAEPNERSSHQVPTPTSGGVGFVLAIIAFGVLHLEEPLARAIVLGGGVLALVSLVDDARHLSAALRLPVHVLAVVAALWVLGMSEVTVGQHRIAGGWFAAGLGLLGVWFVNLYNFMDGIDGFAGSQLVVFGSGVTLLGATDGFASELTWWASATVIGFLWFNWPPARIFMGDVGSAFLGFLVWILALALAAADVVPFVASIVLLTAFWFDATYTLCIRIVTGQAFATAHRSHLYQHLARRVGHGWTVIVYTSYAIVWLFPLSVAVCRITTLWPLWMALACIPMACACWYVGAGLPDSASSVERST